MRLLAFKLLMFLLIFCLKAKSQKLYAIENYEYNKDSIIKIITKDTTSFLCLTPGIFAIVDKKTAKFRRFLFVENNVTALKDIAKANLKNESIIKIHGNIYYDVLYQSNVDTPYYDNNIYQHTIRTYLDVTLKNEYPFRVGFSTHFSNSSMLRDITGINFQFNSQEFRNTLSKKVEQWLLYQSIQDKMLNQLKELVKEKEAEIGSLKKWLLNPSIIQKMVEEKEKQLYSRINTTSKSDLTVNLSDSLLNISKIQDAQDSMLKKYYAKEKLLDTLTNQLKDLEKEYQKSQTVFENARNNLKNQSRNSNNLKSLSNTIRANAIPDSVLPKGYKSLMALKSFNIGRSVLNYSDLTAKNITINGLQVEYNPSAYYAVASGYIDYRYREFIVNNLTKQKQYLNIVRYGRGSKEGNNIIFTFFSGKKQLYNNVSSMNDSIIKPNYNLTGFAIESNFKITQSTFITFEVAKSSLPFYNRSLTKQSTLSSTFSFKDHSNEAYSFRIASYLSKTQTRFTGSYKHIGTNFQSFSLFNTNSSQSLWAAKIEQPFFKRKLNVIASIKTNDFTNPYLDNQFYSKTLFKSIQATMNIRRLPIISIGYFPSSQLIKFNTDQYTETLFYTLNSYVSHFYNFRHTKMNTYFSFSKFYNRQNDSGFIYFNTKNLLLSHTVFLKRFTLTQTLADAVNPDYQLYSISSAMQLKLNNIIQFGCGLKYTKQTIIANKLIGYNANILLKIKKLGDFQFFAEKGYIPGPSRQLVQNNVGRFSYFKIF